MRTINLLIGLSLFVVSGLTLLYAYVPKLMLANTLDSAGVIETKVEGCH